MVYGIGMTVFDTLLYRLPQPWIYYLQGVSFDLMHSIGNVVFFLVFSASRQTFFTIIQEEKMKKIIYSLLAMSVSILILTSCSTTYTQSASNQKEEVKTSQKQQSRYKKMVKTFRKKKWSSKKAMIY